MRLASTVTSVSWIPTGSLTGPVRIGMDLRVTHYDEPPPDVLVDADQVRRMREADRFRFANVLEAWVEVEDGRIVAFGYGAQSRLEMGATTLGLGQRGLTFQGFSLPLLQSAPEATASVVMFTQTVGGRTGVPLPRPVARQPFVQWQAPIVWTTLALSVHADGRAEVDLLGASEFPRHWVYGPDGRLMLKSAVTDQATWMARSFGPRTPWGDWDSPQLVTEVESQLERQMAGELMRAGRRPEIRRLAPGAVLVRQGDPGDQLMLLLDGVLAVDVDGKRVAEVGPGAVLGERAVVEGGRRTSTLVAITPVRVAFAPADAVDMEKLRALGELHRRE